MTTFRPGDKVVWLAENDLTTDSLACFLQKGVVYTVVRVSRISDNTYLYLHDPLGSLQNYDTHIQASATRFKKAEDEMENRCLIMKKQQIVKTIMEEVEKPQAAVLRSVNDSIDYGVSVFIKKFTYTPAILCVDYVDHEDQRCLNTESHGQFSVSVESLRSFAKALLTLVDEVERLHRQEP